MCGATRSATAPTDLCKALAMNEPEASPPPQPVAAQKMGRRGLLKLAAGSLAASAVGLGGYTWRVEPHWIDDVGPIVDPAYLEAALARVAALKPAIVVITGDFVTCDSPERVRQAAQAIAKQRLGSKATLAVLGNHDYGESFRQHELADELAQRLADAGVTLLRNDTTDVEGLSVTGLDDLWSPRFRPSEMKSVLASDRPALVLAHNPDACDLPVWGDYDGWVLSGHTHGGQCRVPGITPPVLPVRNKRYVSGEYQLTGNRRLYINRGLGYLRRVRFAARPEITVFELERDTG